MSVHPGVEALLRIVPDTHRGEERVDWAAARTELGTGLPSDYRSLLDTYGVGDIDELVILPPLSVDVPDLQSWHIGAVTRGFRALWEEGGGVPGVTESAEAVLPWGTGCNANEMGWLTADADPDKWPVVVWRRHGGGPANPHHWAIFDCGMVEFLNRMMRAEFDECPLSDASLWGSPGTFVSWREQRRRLVAGLDPMTGEPDPYADMYPISDD